MPNVMLCGYSASKAVSLKKTVKTVLTDLNLASDAVISIVPMEVEYVDGKPGPYLRICDTNAPQIQIIINALKEAGVREDTEYLVMDGFVPAGDMG